MKTAPSIFLGVLVCLLSGCSIEEVRQWGDSCPPRNIEGYSNYELQYIGTKECTANDMRNCPSLASDTDIHLYFDTKNCPPNYLCHDSGDDRNYYCKYKCESGFVCKDRDGCESCIDPSNIETCGAKNCDDMGQNCKALNGVCRELRGEYVCVNPGNENIICGNNEIDASKSATCGAYNCQKIDNYGGMDCSKLGEDGVCKLDEGIRYFSCQCSSSYMLCDGKCVSPDLACGSCDNPCEADSFCDEGVCIKTVCDENQCLTSKNEHKRCVNEDEQCGKNCANCKNRHDNGYCLNGDCFIRECLVNEHPIYSSSSQIKECEKNSNERCAPVNIKEGEEVVNCSKHFSDALETMCTTEGKCIITKCKDGFHLSKDSLSCLNNTEKECAPGDTSAVKDCSTIENSNATQCLSGSCVVSDCRKGYHLSEDKTQCVPNSDTSCAATNSNRVVNCTSRVSSSFCSSNGECVCSDDGSLVLNSNESSCIRKECQWVVGALSDDCGKARCIPTKCISGYKMSGTCEYGWSSCHPSCNVDADCVKNEGWIAGECRSSKSCYAQAGDCAKGWHLYHGVCLPDEASL